MDDWQNLKPIGPANPRVTPFVRPPDVSVTPPSIRETGTLRPDAEWYPAWMRYRQRDDNYVFWQDKFVRCSLEIPEQEKRWTLFSSLWWLVTEFRFMGVPPALRFLLWLGWRAVMMRAYELHKAIVLWQCKLDAALATRGVRAAAAAAAAWAAGRTAVWTTTDSWAAGRTPVWTTPDASSRAVTAPAGDSSSGSTSSSGGSGRATATTVQFRSAAAPASGSPDVVSASASGSGPIGVSPPTAESVSSSNDGDSEAAADLPGPGFSRAMALRRLHWRNSMLAEVLYCINLFRTGRIHLLPPEKRPLQRPTFFWLF